MTKEDKKNVFISKKNQLFRKRINRLMVLMLSLSFVLVACHHRVSRTVIHGFYYWKTNFNLSSFEDSALQKLNTQKLYVRFFDVDLDPVSRKPQPKAVINFGQNRGNFQIIPVVFITPKALNAMSFLELDFYAKNIAKLLAEKAELIHLNPSEIQIDCDWNERNKDQYFSLLVRLRNQPFFKGKQLSATIRLHQIKFVSAQGIPPVDRGLLMVYNMEPLMNFSTKNSIINYTTVTDYLDNIGTYPLKLDIALPIYSWTLLFDGTRLKGILRGIGKQDLLNSEIFKPMGDNRFLVQKDTLIKGYELSKKQTIRFEESDFKTLSKTARYLSSKIKEDTLTLSLYHCDSINFTHYSDYELEEIYHYFDWHPVNYFYLSGSH